MSAPANSCECASAPLGGRALTHPQTDCASAPTGELALAAPTNKEKAKKRRMSINIMNPASSAWTRTRHWLARLRPSWAVAGLTDFTEMAEGAHPR